MIILRVYRGVADHFPFRRMEWIMLLPTFGMWFALQVSPDMFSISPSFAAIARYASEATWASVVLLCGLLRLIALTVNGTFEGFRLSPHLRALASVVSLFFWSQFTLGFISAFMASGGSPSAIVAYATFCAMEVMNFVSSTRDIGKDVGATLKSKDAG